MTTQHDTQPSSGSPLLYKLLRRFGLILLACVDIYVMGLLFYFLVRAVTGFRLGPVALFNTLLHFALLPAVVLLPIMIALRRWQRAVLTALPVLAFVWLYGGLFLPDRPAPVNCEKPDCVKLTVMTFNLGDGGLDGGRTQVSPAGILEMLSESDVDLAGFQEVTAAQAEAMQGQMLSEYPYQLIHAAGKSVQGIALISRYPILRGEPFYGNPPIMPNLNATLDVQGQPLQVLVVHPPPPAWSLNRHLEYQPRAVAEVRLYAELIGDRPTVLIGDLNATDQNQEYSILTGIGLADTFREVGFGFGPTFPSHKGFGYPLEQAIPLVRVDYIFHTRHLKPVRAWVGPDLESDHMPVIAELAWHMGNRVDVR